MLYVDKEKIQTIIAQQRTTPADVDYLDLDSAAKLVENFENPAIDGEKVSKTTEIGETRPAVRAGIEGADGSRRVIMRQGNEQGAGTKHSVFGHYGTTRGVITAEDVLRIPEVIERGELTEKRRGRSRLVEYQLKDEQGATYTVVNEINKGREEFADFYSDKKASSTARKTHSEEARAGIEDAQSADKGSENSPSVQEGGENRYAVRGANERQKVAG